MNEVMNGANSALKDQTLSLLSRETNKTYIYKNEYTRFNDYDNMVDMKLNMVKHPVKRQRLDVGKQVGTSEGDTGNCPPG